MPCTYDGPTGPTAEQREKARVVAILDSLCPQMNLAIPDSRRCLDDLTAHLCDLCTNMGNVERNRLMYDGRNKDARRLADWWEEHQEADAAKAAREEIKKIPNQALNLLADALKGWSVDCLVSHPGTIANPTQKDMMLVFETDGYTVSLNSKDLSIKPT